MPGQDKPNVVTFPVAVYSPDFGGEEVQAFIQGMFNRTGISYLKYGSIHDNFPHKRSGLENAMVRIDRYLETGNKEELMDAANYLLIEWLLPNHPNAHFRATDSDESPGAVNKDGSVSHGRD